MSVPGLRVSHLSVWFDTPDGRRTLVDDISFELESGQVAGLVGESGCGKTMTAFAIFDQLPAAGMQFKADCIEIGGKDISRMQRRQQRQILGRDIAMIFQQPGTALDPVFTIGHQIEAVYKRHRSGNRLSVRDAMLKALTGAGFDQPDKIAAAYPFQLSGGMRQLAMIAMATVCEPAVLIADEPTTALDISTQVMILQQLKRLQSESNMAILMISHDLSVIRQLCQQVMVMYCGRMVESSPSGDFFAQPQHPYSAGLIACIPDIRQGPSAKITTIDGRVPSMAELPGGCYFAPRCHRAESACRAKSPELAQRQRGAVACFRPL